MRRFTAGRGFWYNCDFKQQEGYELMASAMLAIMNLAVLAIVVAIAYFFQWAGIEFTLGAITGAVFIALCLRLHYGYWP